MRYDCSQLTFLCGHRKSGTTLLANLLDGHPRLAVYPADLALLYAYFPEFVRAHRVPAERRVRLKRILFTDLAERLECVPSDHGLDIEAMAARYFDDLRDSDLDDLGGLIARLMALFQEVSGQSKSSTRTGVFKETSIEIYTADILEWFPDARFIQIVRDPRDNFAALAAGVASHYAKLGENRKQTLASMLHRARLGLRMAVHNRAVLGPERYHVLRFEDLVAEPENSLRQISEFLGIEFENCLLTPTVLSQPTRGNSFEGEEMSSVSARNAGRWRERITQEEAQIIEFHMAGEMDEFGYAPAFEPAGQARASAEFYKWQNYAYFYSDRFPDAGTP